MTCVCFYFQLHQPFRLRRYSVFDSDPYYFDDDANRAIMEKVARKCYRPATERMLELVRRHEGRFRVAFSLTGTILEQFQKYQPDVLERFQALAETGCCEFLAETSDHSLAFLYSREEFRAQVRRHMAMIESLFGQTPRVFRNTELIYNNDLASFIESMGQFDGVLAEGADHVLQGRSPSQAYRPPGGVDLKLLLKNYRLSDDIAFRYSNRSWSEWPLTAEKFARWVEQVETSENASDQGQALCNLFLDYETFGEHQWEETGIFDFLEKLPGAILASGRNTFATPSEVLAKAPADEVFDAPHMISWADTERDLSAWLGNAMQSNALHEIFKLEGPVKKKDDPTLLRDWRRLTASDHYYYMCTKYFADGDVHRYFNPYESPYDSYINFMNVLDHMRTRAEASS